MRKAERVAVFLLLFTMCGSPSVTKVTLDDGAKSSPFAQYWRRCFGSGHAALTLRQDWRDSLTAAVHELGLQGIRHHGLLDDDMGVVVAYPSAAGNLAYNFTHISSSWDYQVALGVAPVVELSFMPCLIAAPSSPPAMEVAYPGPHGAECNSPPKQWDEWYDLIHALASHAVERYGLAVVKLWHFEVWCVFRSLCYRRFPATF